MSEQAFYSSSFLHSFTFWFICFVLFCLKLPIIFPFPIFLLYSDPSYHMTSFTVSFSLDSMVNHSFSNTCNVLTP